MAFDPVLETAFHPTVVAVVGVSANVRRGVQRRANFISNYRRLGFKGRLYPVNPKAKKILGLESYPSVSSIPEHVDLVIVAVPAQTVPAVLEDCIVANVKNVYIFTAGFEETGEEEDVKLGRRVREIALRGGLNIIGPNCMGLYVPKSGIGSFNRLSKESGIVSIVSQSGGHTNWFSHYAPNYGIRFSRAISYGNALVLDVTDYLEYLAVEPDTGIICVYLEGVKDGKKLLRQVREINRTKPVIMWKGGLTESGSRAAISHTASIAGKEATWQAFFAQTKAVPVSSLEEMAEMAMTFLYVKPPQGNRVAVLGFGGGASVASADVCSRVGLELPALTQKTQDELKKFVSLAGSSIKNPLDTGLLFSDVSLLERELELVIADPMIDMFIIMPHLDAVRSTGAKQVDHLINYLCAFAKGNQYGKPVVLAFQSWANYAWEAKLRARLEIELPRQGVAVYKSLAAAARSLSKLYRYHCFRKELAKEG